MTKSMVQRHQGAIASVERAYAALDEAQTIREVQEIEAIAKAVATVERGTVLGRRANNLVFSARVKRGLLLSAIPKSQGRRTELTPKVGVSSKKDVLDENGISQQEASRDEQLSRSGIAESYLAACEKAAVSPRVDVALKLARLPETKQKKALDRISSGAEPRATFLEIRREERMEKLAEIAQGNAPLNAPAELFPVLLSDPPWRYEHVETESRAIENQYPTMSLDEICALPVPSVVTEDSILFLWATSPKLEEAMRVVREWSFTYRTCMVWDKEKIGMGYYARQQHELLLICTRGTPPTPPPEARPGSVVRVARGEHSAKPVEFYELIERMYPTLPKLEMFCRTPRAGWAVWGNQSRAA